MRCAIQRTSPPTARPLLLLRPTTSPFSRWVTSPDQPVQTSRPAKEERPLLSLLLDHQHDRNLTAQIHAQMLASGLPIRSLPEWNALLRQYSLGSSPEEAIRLYEHMRGVSSGVGPPLHGDSFTLSFLLKACANSGRSPEGAQFHGLTVKMGFGSHVYVQTALVNFYCEVGSLTEALSVFDEMPERNLVTWNVVITGLTKWGELNSAKALFDQLADPNVVTWTGIIDGYTRAERPLEALVLFRLMLAKGVKPTGVTVLAIVPAISNLRDILMSGLLHGYCKKNGLDTHDVRVSNSLIAMYASCGIVEKSLQVFEEMWERRNLVSWTSMISGYAMHGMGKDAVELFKRMEEAHLRPNRVTFLGVLNACSHGGLVQEGMQFFSDMLGKHGICPDIKHYGCVVDILGRAGRLEEAEKMILHMPIEVNAVVWRTLLGCCNMFGDAEMGERIMKRVMDLEKDYSGDYVLLSNMLAGTGRFGDAEEVRIMMDESNVIKIPGHSLIGK